MLLQAIEEFSNLNLNHSETSSTIYKSLHKLTENSNYDLSLWLFFLFCIVARVIFCVHGQDMLLLF